MIQAFFLSFLISVLFSKSLGNILGEVVIRDKSYYILDINRLPTYKDVKTTSEPQNDWLLCNDKDTNLYLPKENDKFSYIRVRGVPQKTVVHVWNHDKWELVTSHYESGSCILEIPKEGTGFLVVTARSLDISKRPIKSEPLTFKTYQEVLNEYIEKLRENIGNASKDLIKPKESKDPEHPESSTFVASLAPQAEAP